MLYNLLPSSCSSYIILAGALLTFIVTAVLLSRLKKYLPADIGRAFAVNAAAAKGKPRGAGIIMIFTFTVFALLFAPLSIENAIYYLLIILAMLTGYLDDRSSNPWSELKKGLCDLVISAGIAVTYYFFNGSTIRLSFFGSTATLNPVLFIILAVILVWAAINVVNCTDGVDGLSTSTATVSLTFFWIAMKINDSDSFSGILVMFGAIIAAYLLFNVSPSILLMGDAGSRSMGLFLALCALKCGDPLLFLPLCLVFILDGGLGLIKLSLKRYLKLDFMKNYRLPLHDHFRKNIENPWKDSQVVTRFVVVQLILGVITIALMR